MIGGCSGGEWGKSDVALTERDGDKIVAALAKFHEDNGTFPKSLNELTPKYLPETPTPSVGSGEWQYRLLKNGEAWSLIVDGPSKSDPILWRETGDKSWSYDSK